MCRSIPADTFILTAASGDEYYTRKLSWRVRESAAANSDGNRTKMLRPRPRPRPIKQQQDYVTNKKGLLTQTVARDSAPWWIVIQYRQLAENGAFFIPLSYSTPPLPIFPLEFRGEVMRQETSHGALWWRLRDPNFNRLWLIHPCDGQRDGQTDGQTDGRWHIARYSIYAVAR